MSIPSLQRPTPAVVLDAARRQVAGEAERFWAAVDDTELVEAVHAGQALRAAVAAVEAQMLAELDDRDVAKKQLHWASTTDWYAHTAGVTRRDAKRAVTQAHDLVDARAATLAAMTEGLVSPEQAVVIVRAVGDLPADPGLRERAEAVLLDDAGHLDAGALARAGRHIADVVDPDRAERRAERDLDREERAAHLHRGLSISDDGAGGVRVRGRGSVEDGAALKAALLPLSRPAPAVDPETGEESETDPRDHGARMWDALVGVAQHALTTDAVPDSHATQARVSVLIDLDDLRRRTHDAHRDTGFVTPEQAVTDTQTNPQPTSGAGCGVTDDGSELSAAAVRRLACDAAVLPVVLSRDGAVLDVGREQRTCPHPLWVALVARDRHCTFPACTRPPVMCHAHHIRHWADGGPTALHNLALLCGTHHRVIHHTPWRIRLDESDGRPEFSPPPSRRPGADLPAWTRHRPRRE